VDVRRTSLQTGDARGAMVAVRVFRYPPSGVAWFCCACGGEGLSSVAAFSAGRLRCPSCSRRRRRDRRVTHGLTHTVEYNSWRGMKGRCYDPKNVAFAEYGGRGVRMCSDWLGPDGFQRFLEHVGQRPGAHYSIDRYPNRTGHYEPGNVRWATPSQQFANRAPGCNARALALAHEAAFRYRARRCWARRGTLYGQNEMLAICDDVRAMLAERFGEPRPRQWQPHELTVEEFYASGDYGPGNYHTDGIDDDMIRRVRAARELIAA
jgi:hypothetical protein